MTTLQKINKLTWANLINKLKDILKDVSTQSGGGDSRPYKVYTALLTQSGTNAPVATVLENTLGSFTTSYLHVGMYTIEFPSETLPIEKTYIQIIPSDSGGGSIDSTIFGAGWNDVNSVYITSTNNGTTPSDDELYYTSIEIRVYDSNPLELPPPPDFGLGDLPDQLS